jgi:hypothetical protein
MMLIDGERPLLLEMSVPGSIFYEGLKRFQHVYFYANANRVGSPPLYYILWASRSCPLCLMCGWCRYVRQDNTVNYITASLSEDNPYRGLVQPPPSSVEGYK